MDMVLLDWTRLGKAYCLGGVIAENGRWRVVRPLLATRRTLGTSPPGWSAYLLDGHCRWEVFELIAPEPARTQPPHRENLWVRSMRPRRGLVGAEQRRAILQATTVPREDALFGAPLATTRSAAYLAPSTGQRSLVTLIVPADGIRFYGSLRLGSSGPDIRVELPIPQVGPRQLPVKDHHLLLRAERATATLDGQLHALEQMVRQMGDPIAVRLGLSRAFAADAEGTRSFCWLMADGFFSLTDPQP